jgi:arylsulfatase A-like enzyme
VRPWAALSASLLAALALIASRPAPHGPVRTVEDLRRRLPGAGVLLVVLDAAGARHFGCYGHARPTTPEIDRIAAEGVLFERAYTTAPFTLAAMGSLWTSLLPDHHHRGAAYDDRLPADVPTLAELLSAHGIHTAGYVANWWAGHSGGLDRGFQEFAYVGYRAEKLRAPFQSWLAGRDRRPSFLYLHYREPHAPYDPGPPFDTLFGPVARIDRRALDVWVEAVNAGTQKPTAEELRRLEQLYDGNLALVDREVGWLRRQLEAAGLWDSLVVIVTADHGEALFEHGRVGHGPQLFEETLRVPLVLRFPPAAGLPGRRVSTLVDLLDIAPTVADVFGLLGRGSSASYQGRSLLPVVLGAAGRGEVLARSDGATPRYALVSDDAKFVLDASRGTSEMYDLLADPAERHDLAAAQPARAAAYRQRLERLLAQLPPPWAGPAADRRLTPHDVEELKALGYLR